MADSLVGLSRPRALATAIALSIATLLGGIDLPDRGYAAFQFAPFGTVAALLGGLYVFVLRHRDVVRFGRGWVGILLAVYWLAAMAMAFRLLLPPAGLVQAVLALAAAVAAGIVLGRDERGAAMLTFGIIVTALAILRFSVEPLFEARSGLPNWGPIRFGEASDALRGIFVAYAPQRPLAEVVHLSALGALAVAFAIQWPARVDGVGSPADLQGPDRDIETHVTGDTDEARPQ